MSNIIKSLDALFISKVRIKALKYFVFNPDVPLHLRGAVRELKEEINAVRRELTRLEEINFLNCEVRGNRKYYSLNLNHPLLDELTAIFYKSFGLGGLIIKNSSKLGDVKFAILTGDFIKGKKNENSQKVDLVVIGQVNLDQLGIIIDESEKKLGREINYTVMREAEFSLHKKRRDVFITEFLMNQKVFLIGKSEDFI